METYEEKYKDLVKRLNKAREEKGVYTFNSVLDAVAPELKIDESEDERIRKWLICLLNSMQYHHCDDEREMGNKALAWLERHCEQKPAEWSEEDEDMINSIIRELIHQYNEEIPQGTEDKIKWLKNRLKSLRPWSTWKPSEEQMEALKLSTYCQDKQMSKVLFELYEDLLKLREE